MYEYIMLSHLLSANGQPLQHKDTSEKGGDEDLHSRQKVIEIPVWEPGYRVGSVHVEGDAHKGRLEVHVNRADSADEYNLGHSESGRENYYPDAASQD